MKRALAIGINDYPENQLACAVHDAKEIHDLLEWPEYSFSTTLLLDSSATRCNIRKHIAMLCEESPSEILFFFAGHGCVARNQPYLMTVDTQPFDEGIPLGEIWRLITSNIDPKTRILIILDCCHAGLMPMRSAAKSLTRSLRNEDIKECLITTSPAQVVMAACEGTGKAAEMSEIQHGVFTAALLEGLLGKAADNNGNISVLGLHEFIVRHFKQKGITQLPVFKGDLEGSFILGCGFEILESRHVRDRNVSTYLDRANDVMNEYSIFYAEKIRNHENFLLSGYSECCGKLTMLKDLTERLSSLDMTPPQSKQLTKIISSMNNSLHVLSNVTEGYHTRVGTLIRRLGGGSFGTVWEIQNDWNQKSAYKLYHASELSNKEKLTRFHHGYQAMTLLNYKYIVKVQNYTECPYGIVMDYIDGPNLRDITGAFDSDNDKLRLLLVVAETIQYAHRCEVTHRDLKPENILCKYSEESCCWIPYLTDFDLAWFPSATIVTKEALGTMSYGAPEQLRVHIGQMRLPKVDIYSLAMLMHYIFTGKDPQPFAFANNANRMINALKDRAAMMSAATATKIINLFNDCSAESQDSRLGDLREIIERLHEISEEISGHDPNKILGENAFLKEIEYGSVGIVKGASENRNGFKTASERTQISYSIPDNGLSNTLRICFHSLSAPAMPGQDMKSMTKNMNKRIEEVVEKFGCTFQRGGIAPYEAIVVMPLFALNTGEARRAQKIIARVIDTIERS